jgi:hypothetical protein
MVILVPPLVRPVEDGFALCPDRRTAGHARRAGRQGAGLEAERRSRATFYTEGNGGMDAEQAAERGRAM